MVFKNPRYSVCGFCFIYLFIYFCVSEKKAKPDAKRGSSRRVTGIKAIMARMEKEVFDPDVPTCACF